MTNSIAIIRMKDVKTLLKEIRQVDAFDNRAFFRFRAPVTSRYSVSVIRTDHSYGNKKGLFEIALIDPKTDDVTFNDNFFNGDVGGCLTYEELVKAINSVYHLR